MTPEARYALLLREFDEGHRRLKQVKKELARLRIQINNQQSHAKITKKAEV